MLRRAFERLEEILLVALLAGMTLLSFVQVVLRYVFNTGLLWALEATTYMFGWLILIGISYGIRVHAHIGIDILARACRPSLRRAIGLLVILLSLIYAGIMFYGAYKYELRMFQLGVHAQDIAVPRWVLGLCLPIGFGLLFVRLVEQGWLIARGHLAGFQLADEAQDAVSLLGAPGNDGDRP